MRPERFWPPLPLQNPKSMRPSLPRPMRNLPKLVLLLKRLLLWMAPMKMPKTSKLLDEMLELNKINALVEVDRRKLLNFLMIVRTKAPIIHISFSADPSPLFSQQLVTWLRGNIHPFVLLQIGKQPNIGAGCVLRTTNKYFDLILRQHFAKQRPLLTAKLKESSTVGVTE